MKRLLLTLAAMLAFTFISPQGLHAQGPFTTVGTWTFFVKIAGAPPCQCIQIANLKPDGTIDAPANDHFTGAGLGQWRQVGNGDVHFVILQNAINDDGTAGGLYVIKGAMTVTSAGDSGTGTSTFQILDSTGKPVASGTATFTATKLKLD
jgi:hypothetical protein